MENYGTLQARYAGQWVIVGNKKVLFADPSFERSYEKYKTLRDKTACLLVLIDSGEAIL